MKTHRIAVIAGDGIGTEVMPEGLRCLESVANRYGIRLQWDEFAWDCDYYLKHGAMMPENWKEIIGGHDAIFYPNRSSTLKVEYAVKQLNPREKRLFISS